MTSYFEDLKITSANLSDHVNHEIIRTDEFVVYFIELESKVKIARVLLDNVEITHQPKKRLFSDLDLFVIKS